MYVLLYQTHGIATRFFKYKTKNRYIFEMMRADLKTMNHIKLIKVYKEGA